MARARATSKATPPPLPQTVIPSLGSVPLQLATLSPSEEATVNQFKRALLVANLGTRNPLWNDQAELDIMRDVGFESRANLLSFLGGAPPSGNTMINDRFSKRHTVADMNIPRNPAAMISLSLRYALENSIVAKGAKVKTDYTCADMRHETHNVPAKEFYDEYAEKLNLHTQLRKIVWNLFTVGLSPVYWGGEEGGPITFMQVLNPMCCHFVEILGKMKLFLKIDTSMIDAVKDPTGKNGIEHKALYNSMPKYWIVEIEKMIKAGKGIGLIELADGSYTVVENRYVAYNRMANTLDGLPLQGAFDALQRYRLLAAGDFAVGWQVKNMLTLISEGDPKTQGADFTPADDLRLQKLQAQFANPDYALTIFCDPTTQVRYVTPPLDVFKAEKYIQCEKEIKEVLNLPSFMWTNDGKGTFGAAVAEVELLRREVEAVRLLLREQFFRPLYERLRIGSKKPGFAANAICLPVFDQNSLRDTATWLENVGELYSKGVISLQSAAQANGFDFEYEMKQKEIEHKKYGNTSSGQPGEPMNNTIARPLFEPAQGNLNPVRDKGGAKKKPGSEPSAGPRNPRKTGT